MFYEKYFPASKRNAKELEFMRLQQGNMSLSEYTAKFDELCKFSTNEIWTKYGSVLSSKVAYGKIFWHQ